MELMSDRRRRDDAATTSGMAKDIDRLRPETPAEERQADALMHLVADRAFNELLPDEPRNVPFFEWLARETRLRQTPAERQETERQAQEFAKRLKKRWATEILEVEEVPEPAPRRVAPVETSIVRALELAAGTREAPCLDLAVAAGEGRELWDEVCTEWVDLPPGVPTGRHLALRVSGESMTSVLHDGDTILVRLAERGEIPERGRLVVARRPESGYVVKQLGRVRARDLELLSFNDAFAPVTIPRRAGAIFGTVVLRWCPHGRTKAE